MAPRSNFKLSCCNVVAMTASAVKEGLWKGLKSIAVPAGLEPTTFGLGKRFHGTFGSLRVLGGIELSTLFL
jgi:hypothetical protein